MKAEMFADGTLCVSAETELEAFALNVWSEDYFKFNSTFLKNDGKQIIAQPFAKLLISGLQKE